ncbi:hypothetical protein PG994_001893 [Apiospora phragmitis]|uniref:Uncharacterized protein n=1 Tax=Apiospora phragmitis TaxID=2905665 RepID=A0ABR1WUQ9_9PEZI
MAGDGVKIMTMRVWQYFAGTRGRTHNSLIRFESLEFSGQVKWGVTRSNGHKQISLGIGPAKAALSETFSSISVL